MPFIRTTDEDKAEGKLKELYEAEAKVTGYAPSYVRAFSLRPEVFEAWRGLSKAIRSNMRLRRFELVTVAAAGACHCNTWLLIHGAALRNLQMPLDQIVAVIKDFRAAGLTADEVAVMALAEKVALQAYEVTQADVDGLRAHGLSDEEVFDVILAAAARAFFTKVLEGSGSVPDEAARAKEPEIWAAILARPENAAGDQTGQRRGQ